MTYLTVHCHWPKGNEPLFFGFVKTAIRKCDAIVFIHFFSLLSNRVEAIQPQQHETYGVSGCSAYDNKTMWALLKVKN